MLDYYGVNLGKNRAIEALTFGEYIDDSYNYQCERGKSAA
jgi:hypothetical protein